MRRILSFFALLIMIVGLSDCSGNPFANSLQVTVSNPISSIQAGGAPVTLTAAVAHDKGHAGVTWSLTLAGVSCAPSCGTLNPAAPPSLTAVYTPPSNAPLNQTATITVRSVADKSQIFAFNLTIIPAVVVTITDKFASIDAGAPPVTVDATVANDNAGAGVTWTLTAGGASCSPACGTLVASPAPSFSAVYTAPPAPPTGANASPTITATSVTQTSQNDSFTFTIGSAVADFSGTYTFLLRGFDENQLPLVMAGSITADGQGNLTAAEADIDGDGGITRVPPPGAGTYTVDTSFNQVVRGTFTITSFTYPNTTVQISMKFAMSADGTHGEIVDFDSSGFLLSGTILKQDTSLFSSTPAAIPAHTYAFLLDSDAPVGGRIVEDGEFTLGAAGVAGGLADLSQAGAANPIYQAAPIAAGQASAPDSSGRGTFTLSVQGNSIEYAYYIVNSGQINLVEIDQGLVLGTAQGGIALAQNGPFSANTVNTVDPSVIQMTGFDTIHGTNLIAPDVIIGVLTIASGSTFNLTFDSNDEGIVPGTHPIAPGVVTFDPSTGRGTVSVTGGFDTGFVDSAVFYLSDVGTGFIIDTDPSNNQMVTNNAFSGTFVPQASNLTDSTISGNALARFGGSVIPDIPNIAAAINFDTASNSLTAEGDLTSLSSQFGSVADVTFSGSFSIVDTGLGHGTVSLPAMLFGYPATNPSITASFYIVGPNKFVLIGQQSGFNSGVVFVDPE
jgi:hypothetical protein